MQSRIKPSKALCGSVRIPGDKSISHRYAMLAALANGTSVLKNFSAGADPHSTLGCVASLGIAVEKDGGEIKVHGKGVRGLSAPTGDLDAGNSGSTIRMLSGILAAQPFSTTIFGDPSLSRRPMKRIMTPLQQMGARIDAVDGTYPPITIHGTRELKPIHYELPVASAQVKSCVLFAGISIDGETAVTEPMKTRDHSEIALREFGADISSEGRTAKIRGGRDLEPRELYVPGDLSGAAFFLVATLMARDANVVLYDVGVNPSRTALIDFLVGGGGRIKVLDVRSSGGELVGDLQVNSSQFKGGVIEGALTAALIDEIPVLAVLGAASENGLTVKDAGELRVKETDRIATVAENMRRMGVEVQTDADGFHVPGKQTFRAAEVDSFGDHRIGMAFAVAGLAAEGGETVVNEAEAASVSFPEFFATLEAIRA
ncbi:MAG: 3-phosphoshikimate 1-carboxyvinyltransferase [Acidobacteria bacterium]|nr:3-phosphoshikimate 1-carboxyvinyltransferase [Acidobacteriota bacterium]